MSEMVERVARALHERMERSHETGNHALGWNKIHEDLREQFRLDARAAIAAMREPTEFMEQIGYETNCQISHDEGRDNPCRLASVTIPAKLAYQAMIDEALR